MEVFDTPTNDGTAAVATEERPGGANGTENSTGTEGNNVVNESPDAADLNRGTEVGEVAEDAGQPEGEVNPPEINPEPGVEEPSAPQFDPESFEKNLLQKIEERMNAKPTAPVQLTEEQWAQKEDEFGMSRRAIQKNISMISTVHDKIMQHIDERFARIEKDSVISGMAQKPGFADVSRYKGGMDEYLSRYSPSLHTNPELLEQAYFYAKGKASGQNIQRIRKAGEVNRRIAGPARPATPGGAARKPAAPPLNRIERDTAERFGMTEEEYAKYKVGGKAVNFS